MDRIWAVIVLGAGLLGADGGARDEGLGKVEGAMAEQTRAMISSDDPETQSRVVGILQFDEGLSDWALETMKLPAEQAKGQMDFCLRTDVLAKIGGIFMQDKEKRLEGVSALAKFEEPEAGSMLLRLMGDRDRAVRLAVLKNLAGRKATAEMVDVLWKHAVEDELEVNNSPLAERGQGKGGRLQNYDENFSDQACTALIALKAPAVDEKLKALMARMEDYYEKGGINRQLPWVMDDDQPPMKNAFRLLKAYKSKEAVGSLYRVATGKAYQGSSMAFDANNMPIRLKQPSGRSPAGPAVTEETEQVKKLIKTTYYWSTRTMFIKVLVEITGQKEEDYGLKRCQQIGGVWTVPTAEDEDKAAGKLREWWGEHGKEYGAAETRPAGK